MIPVLYMNRAAVDTLSFFFEIQGYTTLSIVIRGRILIVTGATSKVNLNQNFIMLKIY